MELLDQMDRADLRLLIYVAKLLQVVYECPFSRAEYYNFFFANMIVRDFQLTVLTCILVITHEFEHSIISGSCYQSSDR